MNFLENMIDAVREWFSRLSAAWTVAILGFVTVVAVAGGLFTYQMYDYVQHDNDFCLSCHLMSDPSELFGESAHRGLGCKACHQPTLIDRSMMAVSQIIENPDSLTVHAHVPNERCVSCHVDGTPDEWILIEQSAGHRLHFESGDESLAELTCVERHSTSIHQFGATDNTCSQAGCHTDVEVTLGTMANIAIPCRACHAFSAVIPSRGEEADGRAREALAPNAETCLSCHAMRTLMQLQEDDPHNGVCSSCHKPHSQIVTAEAEQTCTTSGCHDDPMADNAMHRGLAPGVTEGCLTCHSAHSFEAESSACVDCHAGIFDDVGPISLNDLPGRPPGITPAGTSDGAPPTTLVLVPGLAGLIHPTLDPAPLVAALLASQERSDSVRFAHGQHRDVACLSCHSSSGGGHGTLLVTGISDCRSCHHADPAPVDGGCAACHEGTRGPAGSFPLTRGMDFTVGVSREAELSFSHDDHAIEDCGNCHTEGSSLSAEAVDCATCHDEHHQVGNTCRTCHIEAPTRAHPVEVVHTGCAGAGCHTDLPFGGGLPADREFCLTCHQGQANHQTDQPDCAECHRLPPPGSHAYLSAGAAP